MAQQMQTRTSRQATPERWQRALQRASFAGVEAKQLAGSGEWIVSSASRPGIAYRTDGVSCDCEAAQLGADPVCLHRAAYWYAQGVLELDPEPEPPASAASVLCFRCRGAQASCPVCHGAGVAPLSTQATAQGAADAGISHAQAWTCAPIQGHSTLSSVMPTLQTCRRKTERCAAGRRQAAL